MGQFREFADLDDQARKDVFDKFVRRQKVGSTCAFFRPTESDELATNRRRFGIEKEKRLDLTTGHRGNEKGEIVIDAIAKTVAQRVLVARSRSVTGGMTTMQRVRL